MKKSCSLALIFALLVAFVPHTNAETQPAKLGSWVYTVCISYNDQNGNLVAPSANALSDGARHLYLNAPTGYPFGGNSYREARSPVFVPRDIFKAGWLKTFYNADSANLDNVDVVVIGVPKGEKVGVPTVAVQQGVIFVNLDAFRTAVEYGAAVRHGFLHVLEAWYTERGCDMPDAHAFDGATDELEFYQNYIAQNIKKAMWTQHPPRWEVYPNQLSDEVITDTVADIKQDKVVADTTETAFIDLDSETLLLPDDFTVAAYSTNGGKKWTKGAPKLSKVLDKKSQLALADQYKTTKPGDGANVLTFPKINARPKAPRLRIVYESFGMKLQSGGKDIKNGYEFIDPLKKTAFYTQTTGRLAVSGSFSEPQTLVFDVPFNREKARTVLVRKSPVIGTTITPGSKAQKIKHKVRAKASNFKPDKNNKLKLPKGYVAHIHDRLDEENAEVVTKGAAVIDFSDLSPGSDLEIFKAVTLRSPESLSQILYV